MLILRAHCSTSLQGRSHVITSGGDALNETAADTQIIK